MKCNRSFCLPVVPDQASEQKLGLLRMTKPPSQVILSATNTPEGRGTGGTVILTRAMSHIKREKVPENQPRTAASGAKDHLHLPRSLQLGSPFDFVQGCLQAGYRSHSQWLLLTEHTSAMPATERFSRFTSPSPQGRCVLKEESGKDFRRYATCCMMYASNNQLISTESDANLTVKIDN